MATERADRQDDARPATDLEVDTSPPDDDDVQGHVQPTRLSPSDGGHATSQSPA